MSKIALKLAGAAMLCLPLTTGMAMAKPGHGGQHAATPATPATPAVPATPAAPGRSIDRNSGSASHSCDPCGAGTAELSDATCAD